MCIPTSASTYIKQTATNLLDNYRPTSSKAVINLLYRYSACGRCIFACHSCFIYRFYCFTPCECAQYHLWLICWQPHKACTLTRKGRLQRVWERDEGVSGRGAKQTLSNSLQKVKCKLLNSAMLRTCSIKHQLKLSGKNSTILQCFPCYTKSCFSKPFHQKCTQTVRAILSHKHVYMLLPCSYAFVLPLYYRE